MDNEFMVDNNLLLNETSNLRKIIYDLEKLFRQYSDSSNYAFNQKTIRKEIATKFELKSIELKDSLFKIGRELSENKKYLSRSDKNDLEQIEITMAIINRSILFHVGLQENDNWDYDRIIKLFNEGGRGISLVKMQIDSIIMSIGKLSFESKKYPAVVEDKTLQKIKDAFINNAIYWILTIIFTVIIAYFGLQ